MQFREGALGDLSNDVRWQELRASYLAEAMRTAAEALQVAAAAPGTTLPDEQRGKLRQLAHRIRGSAGFFEFGVLAACAAALEEAVLSGASPAALAAAAEELHSRIEAAREARV